MAPASAGPAKHNLQDEKDVSAINSTLDHMRTLTPTDPYILTIPQDIEPRYHHQYRFQAHQWLDHTPFDVREHESVQYQTFVFHEPGKDMYTLHNSRRAEVVENGGVSVRSTKEKIGTGANTPVAGGPKKTMSFGAYKKKAQTGSTPDAGAVKETEVPAKKAAVKGPVERLKADKEVLAAVEEDGGLPLVADEAVADKKDLKRKRGDSLTDGKGAEEDKRRAMEPEEDALRAKKARRTSPPPPPLAEAAKQNGEDEQVEVQQLLEKPSSPPMKANETAEESSLPPRLSPPLTQAAEDNSLPPKLSPIDEIPSLPTRLSPAIPANINATLHARAHNRSVSRSSDVSGPRSASRDARNSTPPAKAVPRNAFRANSSSPAVRSDAEERGRKPVKSVPPRPLGLVNGEAKAQESGDEIAVSKSVEKERMIVKLKFKKSQRESVRRILRMRPDPVKKRQPAAAAATTAAAVEDRRSETPVTKGSDARQRGRRDANAKGVAQRVGPTSAPNGVAKKKDTTPLRASPEQKRPRREDTNDADEPPAKRKKATSDPNTNGTRKPGPSTPPPTTEQKSNAQLTPGKALLSAAVMKREHSTDSAYNTPPPQFQDSPSVSVNGNGNNRAPSSQPSTKTPKQQAWETEQRRLEALGRELKHAATAHLSSLTIHPPDPTVETELAAVKSLESLLAYILAFTCADEAAKAADPKINPSTKTWKSLQPFLGFVKRNCEPFPLLQGLACWLGVVFNNRMLELHTSQPPGSEAAVLETVAMMQRAALEARAKLGTGVLQTAFPRTWAGNANNTPVEERLEVGKSFRGPFQLPFGVDMSPLEAARAGFAMVEEWIRGEGVDYALKLRL